MKLQYKSKLLNTGSTQTVPKRSESLVFISDEETTAKQRPQPGQTEDRPSERFICMNRSEKMSPEGQSESREKTEREKRGRRPQLPGNY